MTNNFDNETAKLQDVIDHVQTLMLAADAESPELSELTETLEKLYKMKSSEKTHRVSPDAILAVAGNLLGIGLILQYERLHVVTSKALGFVMKTKV